MGQSDRFISVTDQTLGEITRAEEAVLILARTDCGSCAAYEEDVHGLLEKGRLRGILIGKVVLDQPGTPQFKRDNSWLRNLDSLPYTLVYRQGVKVDEFAASKGSYLIERLEAVFGANAG